MPVFQNHALVPLNRLGRCLQELVLLFFECLGHRLKPLSYLLTPFIELVNIFSEKLNFRDSAVQLEEFVVYSGLQLLLLVCMVLKVFLLIHVQL